MTPFNDFKKFTAAETPNARDATIQELVRRLPSWQKNLIVWQTMTLIPTCHEKAVLAQSVVLPPLPSSEWALVSCLLGTETDTEVLSYCLQALIKSRCTALRQRIQRIFRLPSLSEKVLFALFQYLEATGDETFATDLENSFLAVLTPTLQEQGFLSLLKLGVISEKVKLIAFSILEQEAEKSPSLVFAALLYLGFSCNRQEAFFLKNRLRTVKNQGVSRLLQMIVTRIDTLLEYPDESQGAEDFYAQALQETIPSFIGYGVFSEVCLSEALTKTLQAKNKTHPDKLTRLILKLKNKTCTSLLANDGFLGIHAIVQRNDNTLAKIWKEQIPYSNSIFLASVNNPEHFGFWHQEDSSLCLTLLRFTDVFANKSEDPFLPWQKILQRTNSTSLILGQILALERETLERKKDVSSEQDEFFLEQAARHIVWGLSHLLQTGGKTRDELAEKVYGACLGGYVKAKFIKTVYKVLPFSGTSWAFTAIAMSAPQLDRLTLNLAILREIKTIRQALLVHPVTQDDFVLELSSRFQSILVGADRFQVQVASSTLTALNDLSLSVQRILDQNENNADKVILRWGVVLQVCLKPKLNEAEKRTYESVLKEGLRTAPHVEKRWLVRALAKLDSEEGIKAILHNTLKHIDHDLVEHSVRELLSTHHPLAQQALIRCLSNPSLAEDLKLGILEKIRSARQKEEVWEDLRSILLTNLPHTVRKKLIHLLEKNAPSQEQARPHSFDVSENRKLSWQDINKRIQDHLPEVCSLSIDARSALCTAEMIFIQSQDWGGQAADLSPIVNMYSKTIELTLREIFEPWTNALVQAGALTKKLEELGYGSSSGHQTERFENHIANLPIIKEIPYFSKFKLQKILKGVCFYRPGKRFTLDGPKAFALFLLVVARRECPFGLRGLVIPCFQTDRELFQFVALVHFLQDNRNRAIHEGLSWDSRGEIDLMRQKTYEIISQCLLCQPQILD